MDEISRAKRALSDTAVSAGSGSIEEFVLSNLLPGQSVEKAAPDELLRDLGLPSGQLEDVADVISPFTRGVDERLSGYLACALTGLTDEQRRYVFQVSDAVSSECASHGIDLYEPRKVTDPNFNPSIKDTRVFEIDRDRVLNSDVLVFLSHYPSVGAGQELDFAYNAMIPIIVVAHSDVRVSRMVTGIPGLVVKITYTEPEELRTELKTALEMLRPILRMRRLAFAAHDRNIVGDRLRRAREAQYLTVAELAAASSGWSRLTEDLIKKWESSTDKEFNPSLLQLRELAFLLKTNVADLVEEDMNVVHLSFLNSLLDKLDEKTAARWKATTSSDRQRLLLRLIERLGVDWGSEDK